MRRFPALCIGLLLLAATAVGTGCGEGGAAADATVSVYAAAPLCKEAQRELAKAGGKGGDLRVRAVCLAPVEVKGRVDLAAAGANARRATEDSTAVAYLEAPGSAAKFSRPILEAANVGWVETSSGVTAMRRVLKALEERGSSSPRDAVRESLEA
ncbi:MAG TPA: hypothetical protein VFP21_09725 [Solirubrobacterales bacterium]|nr:hypothetical protein [Solirubrobacterales bacterium]